MPEPASNSIQIAKRLFDLSTIAFIKSEDHYLLVHHNAQNTMVRGKLREVSAKIDVAWGLQINRSIWVAYSAIVSVSEQASAPLEILLVDDSLVRVSEARRVYFKQNYEQHLAKLSHLETPNMS